MPEVSITRCASYDEKEVESAISELLKNLGGIESFVKPGQKVLLKVNALMGLTPDKACTTHPSIVKAVAKQVLKAGATPFIADEPGSYHASFREIYEICGFKKVADELGIEIRSLKENGTVFVKPKIFSALVKEIPISKMVFDADIIINLCKLKNHMLTVFTGAIKNMYGTVPGLHKSRFHFEMSDPQDFAKLLIEIYLATKPALNIMDAVVSMEGQGPSYGKAKKTGLIIASDDGFALDNIASYLAGYKENEVPINVLAVEAKIGPDNIEDIKISGLSLEEAKIKDFKKGSNYYLMMRKLPKFIKSLMLPVFDLFKLVPVIDKSKCTACQTCVKICPAHAMDIKLNKHYKIDRKKCIICFCCYETCPNKAIRLTSNILKG